MTLTLSDLASLTPDDLHSLFFMTIERQKKVFHFDTESFQWSLLCDTGVVAATGIAASHHLAIVSALFFLSSGVVPREDDFLFESVPVCVEHEPLPEDLNPSVFFDKD